MNNISDHVEPMLVRTLELMEWLDLSIVPPEISLVQHIVDKRIAFAIVWSRGDTSNCYESSAGIVSLAARLGFVCTPINVLFRAQRSDELQSDFGLLIQGTKTVDLALRSFVLTALKLLGRTKAFYSTGQRAGILQLPDTFIGAFKNAEFTPTRLRNCLSNADVDRYIRFLEVGVCLSSYCSRYHWQLMGLAPGAFIGKKLSALMRNEIGRAV
jgi:hypothetical protein